jgi:hypothetical protein
MEAAKAQNWAVEPQGEKKEHCQMRIYIHNIVTINKIFLYFSPVYWHFRLLSLPTGICMLYLHDDVL